jgi:ATP synthase subunit 6
MVPKGTPTPLINFMVIIETTRNIIRPLTLSIRLVANITAGHILLLLARRTLNSKKVAVIAPLIVIIISFLEGAVSYIQAYVFSSLIALYLRETKYEKIQSIPPSETKTLATHCIRFSL